MTLSSKILQGFPWRRFAMDYRYSLAFNLFCGLFITYVLGTGQYLLENLVASMCIGSSAFIIIDGARLAWWGEQRRPGWKTLALIVLAAVPLAQSAGMALFGALMGVKVTRSASLTSLSAIAPKDLSMLLFTLVACAGGLLFFANKEKIARLEALAAAEKARAETVARQALQAQLQLLQAQIEPHMLFNTLANLQGLIGFDPERAQLLLDQLIQYLRATLRSSRAQTTTLAQEFSLMQAYLGLMSVRMGQRLSYTVQLPDALRALAVPPMLLQPLVENAIQHGLEPNIAGGHIAVSAAREGQTLVLTVSDNGLGLGLGLQPAAPARQGTHVGLSNIRERLQALYAEQASFTLTDGAPAGAVARLTLPLNPP
ncbi:sensor histidine kinase [Janthinobacterium fluminis]|uniref:Histidine kinase n=1 Tax=Janthinobacterium fluminis TaxID=2987524 RepID=A0ABT5K0V6_9BURK|nr:histidine kinase [Janthinobacterium fluminis]MDC8757392.1 histidine kinase [Janthinobacterium fluminis]